MIISREIDTNSKTGDSHGRGKLHKISLMCKEGRGE